MYNLGKTNVILGILQLQAHNLKINQKTGEVKMMRYPPLYGKNIKQKKRKKVKKERRIATLEEEKVVRWAVDDKKNWERKEEVEANHRKIEEIVLQKFLKWKRMFGKVKSEKMLIKKIWDHAINLKEIFKPRKGRIYSLSKNEKEKVQKFMEDQLRKRYIRPSKSSQTLPVFFVSKKNRGKRIVIDYHNLNNQTVKNNFHFY